MNAKRRRRELARGAAAPCAIDKFSRGSRAVLLAGVVAGVALAPATILGAGQARAQAAGGSGGSGNPDGGTGGSGGGIGAGGLGGSVGGSAGSVGGPWRKCRVAERRQWRRRH